MACFLSENRRVKLMRDLDGLMLPPDLGEEIAKIHDDLRHVDRYLAQIIAALIDHCHGLISARGEMRARTFRIYVAAESLTLSIFLDEIEERKIPRLMFPHTSKAVWQGLRATSLCKKILLAEMHKMDQGVMQ